MTLSHRKPAIHFFACFFFFACSVLFCFSASAQLFTPVNWTVDWANIPATQNSVKDDLTRALKTCADSTIKPEDLKVYSYDINRDGLLEYIVDLHALKGHWQTQTCDDLPCVGDDCYIWAYYKKKPGLTQMKTAAPAHAPACPATPDANTDCLSYCDATAQQCPQLFRDVYFLVWNNRAQNWALYDPNNVPNGKSLAPDPNLGLVFSVTLNEYSSLCNSEEIKLNGGQCVKYYQWDSNIFYLRDIWVPDVHTTGTWPLQDMHNKTRWDHTAVKNARGDQVGSGFGFKMTKGMQFATNLRVASKGLCPITCPPPDSTPPTQTCKDVVEQSVVHTCTDVPIDRTPVGLGDSQQQSQKTQQVCTDKVVSTTKNVCTDNPTKSTILQNAEGCFDVCYQNAQYSCLDLQNNSTTTEYFIPSNTDNEYSSFINNPPPDVTASECERRYTPWTGDDIAAAYLNNADNGDAAGGGKRGANGTLLTADICSSYANIPCDSTKVVSVGRGCEASLGIDLECGQCNSDDRISMADRNRSCSMTVTCFGPACHSSTSSDSSGTSSDSSGTSSDSSGTSSDSSGGGGDGGGGGGGGGGDGGGGGGGGDCVSGDSQILAPDQQRKDAAFLRVGDTVMGFKVDAPTKLFPAKIKKIGITNLPTVKINDLVASRNHVLITQNRGRVPIDSLQIKDLLLRGDGKTELVQRIEHERDMQTVYTLFLEGADGFVADNLLVLSETASTPGEAPHLDKK